MYIDKTSYIEDQQKAFNPQNWTPLGIEAVVKGTVSGDRNLTVAINLYDTMEAKPVLSKQYRAEKDLLRQLAHNIADDIYQSLTGAPGVFRTRIALSLMMKAARVFTLWIGTDRGQERQGRRAD